MQSLPMIVCNNNSVKEPQQPPNTPCNMQKELRSFYVLVRQGKLSVDPLLITSKIPSLLPAIALEIPIDAKKMPFNGRNALSFFGYEYSSCI